MDEAVGPLIGKRLQEVMVARALTQGQVAAMARMSQPSVHKLLNGKIDDPSIGTVLRVAHALGVGLDQLLQDAPIRSSLQDDVRDLQLKLADLNDRVAPLLERAALEDQRQRGTQQQR